MPILTTRLNSPSGALDGPGLGFRFDFFDAFAFDFFVAAAVDFLLAAAFLFDGGRPFRFFGGGGSSSNFCRLGRCDIFARSSLYHTL